MNKSLIKILIFAASAFISIILSGCSNKESNIDSSSFRKNQVNAQQSKVKPDNTLHKIREEAIIGRAAITVFKIERHPGDQFDEPKAGNEFIVVYIKDRNLGPGNISYNPYMFALQNSRGQITDVVLTNLDEDTRLGSGDLIEGGFVEGTLIFEAPIDDPDLILLFSKDSAGNPMLKFKLN